MNSLQSELQRLYLLPLEAGADAVGATHGLVDAQGRVRAMVLALSGPADWATLSRVWHGAQAELGLPAPAIAVNGRDGCELWFSLAEPVAAARAADFLALLRQRYLSDIKPERVALMPVPVRVPARQATSGHWSAFVAPDLAPVFADEPWLDLPPGESGQSELLSRLRSITPADFAQARALLQPAADAALAPGPAPSAAATVTAPAGGGLSARQFLIGVMNDDRVALGLRIEAAKALLSAPEDPPT